MNKYLEYMTTYAGNFQSTKVNYRITGSNRDPKFPTDNKWIQCKKRNLVKHMI
jgi:hypothetical protein